MQQDSHLYAEAIEAIRPVGVDDNGTIHVRSYGDPDPFDTADALNPFAVAVAAVACLAAVGLVLGVATVALVVGF